MDSIAKNALIKCPVCGIRFEEHPTENSTCWRYRPKETTAAQSAEVARQDGLTLANLGNSANGAAGTNGAQKRA